jgi:hypothetical protein
MKYALLIYVKPRITAAKFQLSPRAVRAAVLALNPGRHNARPRFHPSRPVLYRTYVPVFRISFARLAEPSRRPPRGLAGGRARPAQRPVLASPPSPAALGADASCRRRCRQAGPLHFPRASDDRRRRPGSRGAVSPRQRTASAVERAACSIRIRSARDATAGKVSPMARACRPSPLIDCDSVNAPGWDRHGRDPKVRPITRRSCPLKLPQLSESSPGSPDLAPRSPDLVRGY